MIPFLSSDQPGNYPDRFRGLLPVASLAGSLALLAWNWALALSLILGALVTFLLYRLQLSPWQTWFRSGQNYLQALSNSPQGVLMVAVLGGSLTLGGTYLTTAYRDWETDRKSTRLNSSHSRASRMPSSA